MKDRKEKIAYDINILFPNKVYINLDRRPDRMKKMEERFALHGIGSVVRYPAVDGLGINIPSTWPHSPGQYGCLQSHLAVIKTARENRLSNILIFEDDCVFDKKFKEKFGDYIERVPNDWEMLLFGGSHTEKPVWVSDDIVKPSAAYRTHAYAIGQGIYDPLIELCEQGRKAIDEYTVELQKTFNCYCFSPDLVWQEARIDSDTR